MAMRGHGLAGVLYAEDFDEPERARPVPERPAPVQAPPPPIRVEPTFSLVELQRAVEQALEEGQTLERSKNEEDEARRSADALERLAGALEGSREREAADRAAFAAAMADVVMGTLAALLPELNARHGMREVAALCSRVIPTLAGERRLVIRAQAASVPVLRDELSAVLHEHAVEAEWCADAAMGPADLTVRWEYGALTRDAGTLVREIVALIAPEPEADGFGAHHGQ